MSRRVVVVLLVSMAALGGCERSSSSRASRGGDADTDRSEAPQLNAAGLVSKRRGDGGPQRRGIIWRHDLDHHASSLHITPSGDVVVIGPRRLTVLDPRGRQRWYRNMAPGDRVLPSAGCLYLELANDPVLIGLDDRGRHRWQRMLAGVFEPLGDGRILVTDAATVRALGCRTGRERWMFSPDRIRSLKLLGSSAGSVELLGEIGQQRFLFSLTPEGQLRSTTKLPPLTTSLTHIHSGQHLARTESSISMVDPSGRVLWHLPITSSTEAAIHGDSLILASGEADGVVHARRYTLSGREEVDCAVSVGAETVSARVIGVDGLPLIVAACAGALSSCAEGGLSSGPFNRLWACSTDDGEVTSLINQEADLYFDISASDDRLVVVATPASGVGTSVIQLDPDLTRTPLAVLPGRRMLGPVAGPQGRWYVATCHGLLCGEPWTLLAINSQEADDGNDTQSSPSAAADGGAVLDGGPGDDSRSAERPEAGAPTDDRHTKARPVRPLGGLR